MLALDRHHHRILIGRDLIAIPPAAGAPAAAASLVTVAANIAHHGYGLAADAYAALARLGEAEPGPGRGGRVRPCYENTFALCNDSGLLSSTM